LQKTRNTMIADLRSDTLTLPSAGMLEAMMKAPLGDDVWGEDPSTIALEHALASHFGMEAGLFCPSGTQCNQIAIKTHTRPGEELLCEVLSHVYQYEAGAYALLSGLSVKTLQGQRGKLNAEQVEAGINPQDIHKAPSTLLCLENTCNKGGGTVYRLDEVLPIRALCLEKELALHLDGARIFNALVASGEDARAWGSAVDSISVCLSKGLGCPVGSVLLGSRSFIAQARRWRKVFGGGMRQAGILAAAGLYALEHHVAPLAEDHRRAARLGACVSSRPWCQELYPVESNIVLFRLRSDYPNTGFLSALEAGGVKAIDMGPGLIRLVTHRDIDDRALELAIGVMERIP
jgi:threonine aldolase